MANWRELNDPMEGYFTSIFYDNEVNYKSFLQDFIDYKVSLKICSFSQTIKPILLWSHYANQHRGIAIEITLNKSEFPNLYKVNYVSRIPEIDFAASNSQINVLTNKVSIWSHEREYRVIDNRANISLGTISGIYFGVRTSRDDKQRVKNIVGNSISLYNTRIDFNKNHVKMRELY